MSTHRDGEQKRANQLFRELMDQTTTHLRVGTHRRDVTEVRFLDMAQTMHGPGGCCTCCHGRSAATQGVCPVCLRYLPRRLAGLTTHPTCDTTIARTA